MDYTQALIDAGLQSTSENIAKCQELHKENPKMTAKTVVRKLKQADQSGDQGRETGLPSYAAEMSQGLRQQFGQMVLQEVVLGGFTDAVNSLASGSVLSDLAIDVDYMAFVESQTQIALPSKQSNKLLRGTKDV